jgi:hypothetical protein
VGAKERIIYYNRLIESLQRVEGLVSMLKEDVMDSYSNTDPNFPNKLEKLKGQLESVQLIENQLTELGIEIYNFKP